MFIIIYIIFALPAVQAQQKRVYIAPDDHTDYFWSGGEATYRQAFLDMLDYYLGQADTTSLDPSAYQARWNCDGSFWVWTYERNKTAAEFDRLIGRIRDGHVSMPLNPLVVSQGQVPAEAVLRGMYYPGRLERRYKLRFPIAIAMENQTQPLGLGSLWAGSGARYSWKGICGCDTKLSAPGDRESDIYWAKGLDGSSVLMKWNSMLTTNKGMGGYAEARDTSGVVDYVTTQASSNGFLARYPFGVIGCFGKGWDDLETFTTDFPTVAKQKTDATRRVIVSNQVDFFQDFEKSFAPSAIPTITASYGNEWELYAASLAEESARVKRSVEKLRAAEAMAAIVSLQNPCFMNGRETARDLAFMDMGLFWEHNFGMVGKDAASVNDRIAWQKRLAGEIESYVDTLYSDSVTALSSLIVKTGTNVRFFAFNPLGWTRTDYADFPSMAAAPLRVVDVATGAEVPSQIVVVGTQRRIRILAQNLPPVGYKVYEVRAGAGATWGNAAAVSGNVIENTRYRVTVSTTGAVTSLVDKQRANREMVRVVAGRTMNDLGGGSGSLVVENAGAVTVTLLATAATPLAHTSRVTLIRDFDRIELKNEITQNFTDDRTWGFGFNVDAPVVNHEEVGAILTAKLTSAGGHYATRNARYDWLTLNHFADLGGTGGGMTLSNADLLFMQLGSSESDLLDTTTPGLSVLAGGRVANGTNGLPNQGGDSDFVQRFALRARDSFDPAAAMQFAMEHQNPIVTGAVTGGAMFPETTYSLLTTSGSNVLLWSVKPSEEGVTRGIVTRYWNLGKTSTAADITFTAGAIDAASTATHIETATGPANALGGVLHASFAPQQMLTFVLRLDEKTPIPTPVLKVSRSGQNITFNWTKTAQSCYQLIRGADSTLGGSTTVYTGSATTASDTGAAAPGQPRAYFYAVQ